MAILPRSGLESAYTDGQTPYTAEQIARVHNIIESQLFGMVQTQGVGVLPSPTQDSFKVTAGTGLSVNIAAGSAVVATAAYGSVLLSKSTSSTLAGLTASSTVYIHAGANFSGADSRTDGAPLFVASSVDSIPDAVLLATVVTGASTITSVTDSRVIVGTEQMQDVLGAALVDSTTLDYTYNDAAGTETAEVKNGALTNTHIATGANIDAAKIGTGVVSTTELNYLDGVTSAIQTQLNAKASIATVARTVTTSTTVTTTDDFIFVDATSGNLTVTLLAANNAAAHRIGVKKIDATANTVTIQRAGSDTIDGATTRVLSAQWENVLLAPNGSNAWGAF